MESTVTAEFRTRLLYFSEMVEPLSVRARVDVEH